MVVSSGFLDHAAEVYLRASDSIMSAQPIASSNVREWSQQLQQQTIASNQLNAQNSAIKVNSVQHSAAARVILLCQPNSHPFQTRNITLDPRIEVKVGRSVPRSRVEESNAIFDCKVLSRNHAVIWYSDGKFFIKDTGSSNGTFINTHRIQTSEPYEISSGDIVQFGVDVTENSRKETHGCIIAQLKLITPDGLEKTSYHTQPSIQSGINYDNDIYRLNQIMHETFQREQILESKLISLQKAVETTRKNSSNSWQAMIHEDLLLSRIDILENKLLCYQKNITDDKLQKEVSKLQDEKTNYQAVAKETLKKVYQERMGAQQECNKTKQACQLNLEEIAVLRSQLDSGKELNKQLTDKIIELETAKGVMSVEMDDLQKQFSKQTDDTQMISDSLETVKKENEELKNRLRLIENINASELINVDDDEEISDTNKNLTSPWNKSAIMDWLNNSDIRNQKGSEGIINAMCNDVKNGDSFKLDAQKCSQLFDKLLDIEKKYIDNRANSDSLSKHSDDSVSTLSDGNQNNRQCVEEEADIEENRNFVKQLKEVYAEFQLHVRILQKELMRAAKYDELQSKYLSLQNELRSRLRLAEYEEEEKLKEMRGKILQTTKSKSAEPSGVEIVDDDLSNCNDNDYDKMGAINQSTTYSSSSSNGHDASMQQHQKQQLSSTNKAMSTDDDTDVDTSIVSTVISDCSFVTQIAANANDIANLNDDEEDESNGGQTVADDDIDDDDVDDDCDEKDVLESFDRIIEEENKIINGTDIMREEELVEFKERCIKLTDENISLRKEIGSLRVSGNKNITAIIYTASLAILLIYYLLTMIFS